MGLAARPAYLAACYATLAERYDWSDAITCECLKVKSVDYGPRSRFGSRSGGGSGGPFYLSREVVDEGFHHCPTHKSFRPDVLCSHHLECNDPVARCFLLARTCSAFAGESLNYAREYSELADRCKGAAVAILDSCASASEVRLLLQEEAAARKFFKHIFVHRYPQLTLAVEHEHKEFVTHPYCMQLVEREFMGGASCKESSIFFSVIRYYLILLFLPIHILIYIIVRWPRHYMGFIHGSSSSLMFGDIEEEDMTRGQRMIRYLDNMKVVLDNPYNRFIAYTGCYWIFAVLLLYCATTPVSNIQQIAVSHNIIFLFSFGHLLTDLQYLGNGSWTIFATFWRLYHSFGNIILNIGFALKLAIIFWCTDAEAREVLELMSNICYAISTITTVVGLLYWLQLHRKMGPIIIQISHIIPEFGTIILIWFVVLQGFVFGLFFMMFGSMESFSEEDSRSTYKALAAMLFWSLLNPGPPDFQMFESDNMTSVNGTQTESEAEPESVAYTRWMFSMSAIFIYQMLSAVLILNLLIAALNTTIARLDSCKEMNYKYCAARELGQLKSITFKTKLTILHMYVL